MSQGMETGGLGGRLTDLVPLGAITSLIPRDVLDEVIEAHGCLETRVRELPSHLVVYPLVALCLFPDDDYEEVAEKLTGWFGLVPGVRRQAPSRGAITQARQRLGAEVMREVFTHLARPVATRATPGAWLERWRLMATDGVVLDLPDTEANIAEFGKDHAGAPAVCPQARVVVLSECAGHAPVAADLTGCWAWGQTRRSNRNPPRRHRSRPRPVKRARHNSCPERRSPTGASAAPDRPPSRSWLQQSDRWSAD